MVILALGLMAFIGTVVQGEDDKAAAPEAAATAPEPAVTAAEDSGPKDCNPIEVDETKRIGEVSGADLGKYNEDFGKATKEK